MGLGGRADRAGIWRDAPDHRVGMVVAIGRVAMYLGAPQMQLYCALNRWQGYKARWNTWEPADNLDNAAKDINEFNKKSSGIPQKKQKKRLEESRMSGKNTMSNKFGWMHFK